jgi:hypothetical protein
MRCQRGDTPPSLPEPLGRGQLLQSRLTELGAKHVALAGDGPRAVCKTAGLRVLPGSTPGRCTNFRLLAQ